MNQFELLVSTPELKFNCAHFIAFKGFREKLHGHNYTMSVRVVGNDMIAEDGYVIDFGDIKKSAKSICQAMNETFICPMLSDAVSISQVDTQLCMVCDDGATFSMPIADCSRLPIYHSSAEEIAHYIWCRLIRSLGLLEMNKRGITSVEVGISEAPSQTAYFRSRVPFSEHELREIEASKIRRATPCAAI